MGQNAVSTRTVVKRDSVTKQWSASTRIPLVSPRVPGARDIAALASATVGVGEQKEMARWIAQAKADVIELRKIKFSTPLEFYAETTLRLNDVNLLSFRTMCYTYMGGAHGMTVWRHYNFGRRNGEAARIGVWDILRSDEQTRRDFKMMLLGKAMVAPGADWIDEGMITDFTDAQLQNFWINKDGLCWDFEPYALGSYAAGTITLRAKFAELKNWLRPGGPIDVYLQKR